MTTKLISGTGLQLLRRYDNRSESHRAQLLDDVMLRGSYMFHSFKMYQKANFDACYNFSRRLI